MEWNCRTAGVRMSLLMVMVGLGACAARADFYVGSTPGAQFLGVTPVPQVLHYDNSGNFLGVFVAPGNGLDTPRGLAFGPDGNLYVSSTGSNSVLRYDPTGTFIDAFVPSGSGGLVAPEALVFQNDGFLYVSNFGTNPTTDPTTGMTQNMLDGQVTRYNATTGAFGSLFAQSADIRGNVDGMTFGPNGDLFVSVLNRNSPDVPGVLSFDGTTGNSKGEFTQGGNLALPRGLTFGPDGNLYVVDINPSNGDSRVARFNGTSGQYMDDYIPFGSGLMTARGVGFGPDARLYVSTFGPLTQAQPFNLIWAFDGTTLSTFIDGNADSSMLTFPTYFVFQ